MNRKSFVDVARFLAVIFALSDHALRHFGIMEHLSGIYKYPIAILFRSATPTFFLLFGLMIEYVYIKKYAKHGINYIFKSSLLKSSLCYSGFALIVFVNAFYNDLALGEITATLYFNGFADAASGVLKFYALAFLLIPLIILARIKVGRLLYVIVFACIWGIIDPIIKNNYFSTFNYIDLPADFSSFMVGAPYGKSAFSFLHGISIVCLGAFIGSYSIKEGNKDFVVLSGYVLVFCLSTTLLYVATEGVSEFLTGFKSNFFRYSHYYVYYAFTVSCALSILIALALVVKHNVKSFLFLPGLRSLFCFTYGGVLLIVIPERYGLVGFVAYWVIIYFFVSVYDKIKRNHIQNRYLMYR